MIKRSKIIKIGNSVGVILPKEVLAQLRVEPGDEVCFGEAPGGVMLTTTDSDFIQAVTAAEDIIREDRDILAALGR